MSAETDVDDVAAPHDVDSLVAVITDIVGAGAVMLDKDVVDLLCPFDQHRSLVRRWRTYGVFEDFLYLFADLGDSWRERKKRRR